MGATRWSVRLAVDEAISGRLTTALASTVGHEIWGIALARPTADFDDGSDTVTFELDAPDGREARILAQHWLGEACRKSGLPVEQARVIWVAPLLASPRSSHRFIEIARTLVEDETTADLAVVAAQIHLELHVKALITTAVADDPSPLRAVLVDDDGHTWGPHHPTARGLLKALFGVEPARDYPRWQDYADHIKRRNAISHRGQAVSLADAQASMAIVDDLWLWLNAAAGRADGA
jgi:hypothetical protein